ncbi:uncharacterized protein BDZ99DRAFT_382028 [Mytilinidion resinicola]|uniref:C2H2-type domain-containing protein n=1 Tax=Mytilinidion resinicola TaxID=574789 RepID=A0A6A6YW71_9PEZI|nr:uncharacterized protein BDZ99DRAFT_382028 [Mytilinidion resinicola]KAF2813192.1 hypothetical protein BDZ99DRAFT_382028 [Mytilinidion resinicola]
MEPSSDDGLRDQLRSPSLLQSFRPTPKDNGAYICRWKPTSSVICFDQFKSAEALHNHIKACHIGKTNGSCFCQWEGCDEDHTKDFKQRSKLARHLLVHAGYRPYKCGHDGCEKTFATNQAKDNHERTHAGNKPYQCQHCPYVTTTATQLKTHINAKHIKDKCFHCRICAFCCADSSNLSKHEKTHRARPYRCLHPSCTFKNDCRWENVKRHFKKSGHCPELLVDDSPEQVRYKQEAAELAKRDPLPKKVSRVRRTGEVAEREEGESSC